MMCGITAWQPQYSRKLMEPGIYYYFVQIKIVTEIIFSDIFNRDKLLLWNRASVKLAFTKINLINHHRRVGILCRGPSGWETFNSHMPLLSPPTLWSADFI